MSLSEVISPLVGRWLLAWFFVDAGRYLAGNWYGVTQQLLARHVPLPPLVQLVALVLLAIGALSLLLGYQARHGAVLLLVLTLAAAFLLHDFWHIADPASRRAEFVFFTRDVAICGGLLMLVGLGAGPFSIDARAKAKAPAPSAGH